MLPKPLAEKLKSHLIFCNSCRQQLRDLENQVRVLRQAPTLAPTKELEDRILSLLSNEGNAEEDTPADRGSRGRRSLLPVAIPLVISAALGVFLISRRPASPPVSKPTAPDPDRVPPAVPAHNRAPSAALSSRTAAAPVEEKSEDPFRGLAGQRSGVSEPMETVIKTQAAWEKLWKRHAQPFTPPPPVPAVDFQAKEVIAVFAGTRPSGGHEVQIVRIEGTTWNGAPARLVSYRVTKPRPGTMAIMVISQPFSMKVMSRQKGEVFFRKIP